jgi:hypothetical protein
VVGHRGSGGDTNGAWRWYITLRPTAGAPRSSTQPVRIWENPRISTFQRPLTFAEGAWRLRDREDGYIDSQASRLALRVKGDGACGDDTIRLNLHSFRDRTIALRITVYADNTAKVLRLTLRDTGAREATWIYDLPAPSQIRLHPRDGASLSRPNIPPFNGESLDLRRINKWTLAGERGSEAVLSVEIQEMTIE